MGAEETAEVLYQQVVQTPALDALHPACKALDRLRSLVEASLAGLKFGIDLESWLHTWIGDWSALVHMDTTLWKGIIDEAGVPRPNFQIHVCKWSDIRNQQIPRRVKYKQGIRKVKDSGGSVHGSVRTVYPDNGELDAHVGRYFYQLFCADGAPARQIGDLLDEIDRGSLSHRVVLSIDYYYARSLAQLGLHKDTTGNTLFVGLHYNNEDPMQGPEYIYDFFPLPSVREGEDFNAERMRYHAPWSFDESVKQPYWPHELRLALQIARDRLESEHKPSSAWLHATTMEPNGLITFVDELIFHVTPLTRKRSSEERSSLFQDVNIGGTEYPLIQRRGVGTQMRQSTPPMLRRQFSESNLEGKGTSRDGRRSFVRFWAMVEPRAWHDG